MKKLLRALFFVLGLIGMSGAIAAPQTGTWLIGNGQNIYGGNIINIDAQDNQVYIIFAVGAVPNDTFFLAGRGILNGDNITVDLGSTKDGSVMHVTGTFDSSSSGTLNFPGIGQRSIARIQMTDVDDARTMLGGYWMFTYVSPRTDRGVTEVYKFTSVKPASATGTGIVSDSAETFACEYQSSGEHAGKTLCGPVNKSSPLRHFVLKRSGNEAEGIFVVDNSKQRFWATARRIQASDNTTSLAFH